MFDPELTAAVERLQQRKAVLLSKMRQLGAEELSVRRAFRLDESDALMLQIEVCKREVVVINLILESGNTALWKHYKDTYEVADRERSV